MHHVQKQNLISSYTMNEINIHLYHMYYRPLIPPKHQVDYDKLAPPPPGRKLRSVTLRRHGNESFGFAVRGGNHKKLGDKRTLFG